jgi:hypothetical protein
MGPEMRWVQLQPPGAQTSVTLVTFADPDGNGLVLQQSGG